MRKTLLILAFFTLACGGDLSDQVADGLQETLLENGVADRAAGVQVQADKGLSQDGCVRENEARLRELVVPNDTGAFFQGCMAGAPEDDSFCVARPGLQDPMPAGDITGDQSWFNSHCPNAGDTACTMARSLQVDWCEGDRLDTAGVWTRG